MKKVAKALQSHRFPLLIRFHAKSAPSPEGYLQMDVLAIRSISNIEVHNVFFAKATTARKSTKTPFTVSAKPPNVSIIPIKSGSCNGLDIGYRFLADEIPCRNNKSATASQKNTETHDTCDYLQKQGMPQIQEMP
jgi:hypothetical protein